jgi:methylisocitrate lyase
MNAMVALLAKEAGFKALYLSGASLSSANFGMPDLGVLTLNDIVEEAKRITYAVDLPLIVDIDNGWNHPLLLERAAIELKSLNATIQIEDQCGIKRCGHLPIKELVSQDEMKLKIRILKNRGLKVVARTDSLGLEGLDSTLKRLKVYKEAGADYIFVEALRTQDEIKRIKNDIDLPLMVNLTEFGKTPLWTLEELAALKVNLALYPMTINRVVYNAARKSLQELRASGSQKNLIPEMMTRDELYRVIHYQEKEGML